MIEYGQMWFWIFAGMGALAAGAGVLCIGISYLPNSEEKKG